MDGTERLFERMVHEHQDRVFALSLALAGNRHDAVKSGQSQPSRLEAWVNPSRGR